jgi:hypothetical protein
VDARLCQDEDLWKEKLKIDYGYLCGDEDVKHEMPNGYTCKQFYTAITLNEIRLISIDYNTKKVGLMWVNCNQTIADLIWKVKQLLEKNHLEHSQFQFVLLEEGVPFKSVDNPFADDLDKTWKEKLGDCCWDRFTSVQVELPPVRKRSI